MIEKKVSMQETTVKAISDKYSPQYWRLRVFLKLLTCETADEFYTAYRSLCKGNGAKPAGYIWKKINMDYIRGK